MISIILFLKNIFFPALPKLPLPQTRPEGTNQSFAHFNTSYFWPFFRIFIKKLTLAFFYSVGSWNMSLSLQHNSLLHVPCSLFHIPCSMFHAPCASHISLLWKLLLHHRPQCSANCFTHGGGKDCGSGKEANFTLLGHTTPPHPVLRL